MAKKQNMEEIQPVSRMPWDLSLVMLATVYILMRLSKIGMTFLAAPGDEYNRAVVWIGYPLVALIWGVASRPLQFKYWWMLVICLIGMAGGLYFGHGAPFLIYLVPYLAITSIGFFIAKFIFKAPKQTPEA
jgi:hypothetical protein